MLVRIQRKIHSSRIFTKKLPEKNNYLISFHLLVFTVVWTKVWLLPELILTPWSIIKIKLLPHNYIQYTVSVTVSYWWYFDRGIKHWEKTVSSVSCSFYLLLLFNISLCDLSLTFLPFFNFVYTLFIVFFQVLLWQMTHNTFNNTDL